MAYQQNRKKYSPAQYHGAPQPMADDYYRRVGRPDEEDPVTLMEMMGDLGSHPLSIMPDGSVTIKIYDTDTAQKMVKPLSITELKELTGWDRKFLTDACTREDDPLPSFLRGKKLYVMYGDFIAWVRRNYGLNGTRRGTEVAM